jgi:hypothetical protein
MKTGIRKKEGEDLSHNKIEEIINLLNLDKPITKKDACAMLNIAYNTTRLNKIIDAHNEQKAYDERRRKELRSAPLSIEDISYIISSYLEESNISLIAEQTHRSSAVIKRVLERYNIPLRTSSVTYHNPLFLSDESIADEYTKDDLVYSARYDQPCYISRKFNNEVYKIWLIKDEQYAFQPYYELGDLRRLQKELNIKIETRKWWDDLTMQHQVAQALKDAKKRKKTNE